MKSVTSSNLARVGYVPRGESLIDIPNVGICKVPARTLVLEFKRGGLYFYRNVTISLYKAMMDAPSQGVFFSANIRNLYPTFLFLGITESGKPELERRF